MKVTPALSRILSESLLAAKDLRHQFFTPEHVLASAIHDEQVENLLISSGVDTKELQNDLINYLNTKLPVISSDANPELMKDPVESAGFQAMMVLGLNAAYELCKILNNEKVRQRNENKKEKRKKKSMLLMPDVRDLEQAKIIIKN